MKNEHGNEKEKGMSVGMVWVGVGVIEEKLKVVAFIDVNL